MDDLPTNIQKSLELEDITLIGEQHEMYPMYLEDHLLTSSAASPIVNIQEYCEDLKFPLILYTGLSDHMKIRC